MGLIHAVNLVNLLHQTGEFMSRIVPDWRIGHHPDASTKPKEWLPSSIPGAVQLDYARAHNWPPYYESDHYKSYTWMEDCYWTYSTTFIKPEMAKDDRLYFICLGIDYKFEIYLNDHLLLQQEGMFTPVRLDLTEHLSGKNELRITLFPVPKVQGAPPGRVQASHSVKPAVSYGWDWHPRLVPSGIWDEAFLEVRPFAHINHLSITYELDNENTAILQCKVAGCNLDGCRGVLEIMNPAGESVNTSITDLQNDFYFQVRLQNIDLWWPYDHGVPNLYTYRFTLQYKNKVTETHTGKIGFRKIRLVMNEGAWDEPDRFPKSRSHPPMQLEINGRNIFCKGSNWVGPDIFPGTMTTDRYRELLENARSTNFNMLRIWGGSAMNKKSFYDLCDEFGILVWQDFPLACNDYPDTPEYLDTLRQEATSIVQKLVPHPCLAIWCGGNELYNAWSGMTDQSLALRLLNSICLELDPHTPFIPTAPLSGMGHGHYMFRDPENGGEILQWMPDSHCTAYTEFGVPGPSSLPVLQSFIPETELFPPRPGTAWEAHHAYNSWKPETWLVEDQLRHYFGEPEDLETLIGNGQLLQSQGYKHIFEEARRQKPYCSMAMNWCFNEPWPTAANNSLINWPCHPKPALQAVSASCRPVLASARIPKFVWHAGETFTCDLWILNDNDDTKITDTVTIQLAVKDHIIHLLTWDFQLNPNTNLAGPSPRFVLQDWDTDRFRLLLHVNNHPELDSEYVLLYRKKSQEAQTGQRIMNL